MGRINTAGMLRVAAWCCVLLLALLSLLPAEDMVRTDLGGLVEHAVAYTSTAFLMRLGYPGHGMRRTAAALIGYAGVLELLQYLSPGRHPGLDSWIASSVGVILGVQAARLALVLHARVRNAG